MRNGARGSKYAVGFVAGLAVLALFVFPRPAAQNDKPEKIKTGPIKYDRAVQAFVVPTSAKFGIATAARAAGFSLRTKLEIADPDFTEVTGLGPQVDPVEWREGSEPDRDGFVVLVPPTIPWDRNGGTISGDVIVTTTLQLLNPVRKGSDGGAIQTEIVSLSLTSVGPVRVED